MEWCKFDMNFPNLDLRLISEISLLLQKLRLRDSNRNHLHSQDRLHLVLSSHQVLHISDHDHTTIKVQIHVSLIVPFLFFLGFSSSQCLTFSDFDLAHACNQGEYQQVWISCCLAQTRWQKLPLYFNWEYVSIPKLTCLIEIWGMHRSTGFLTKDHYYTHQTIWSGYQKKRQLCSVSCAPLPYIDLVFMVGLDYLQDTSYIWDAFNWIRYSCHLSSNSGHLSAWSDFDFDFEIEFEFWFLKLIFALDFLICLWLAASQSFDDFDDEEDSFVEENGNESPPFQRVSDGQQADSFQQSSFTSSAQSSQGSPSQPDATSQHGERFDSNGASEPSMPAFTGSSNSSKDSAFQYSNNTAFLLVCLLVNVEAFFCQAHAQKLMKLPALKESRECRPRIVTGNIFVSYPGREIESCAYY